MIHIDELKGMLQIVQSLIVYHNRGEFNGTLESAIDCLELAGYEIDMDEEPMTEAQCKQGALDAGIPLSVIEGKTKLTDHFSQEYIDYKCNKKPKAQGGT